MNKWGIDASLARRILFWMSLEVSALNSLRFRHISSCEDGIGPLLLTQVWKRRNSLPQLNVEPENLCNPKMHDETVKLAKSFMLIMSKKQGQGSKKPIMSMNWGFFSHVYQFHSISTLSHDFRCFSSSLDTVAYAWRTNRVPLLWSSSLRRSARSVKKHGTTLTAWKEPVTVVHTLKWNVLRYYRLIKMYCNSGHRFQTSLSCMLHANFPGTTSTNKLELETSIHAFKVIQWFSMV